MQKRRLWLIGSLFGVVISAVVLVVIIGRGVSTDDPVPQPTSTLSSLLVFPKLTGTNLNFSEVRIPTDWGTGTKLIVVSYESAQQPDVDAWLLPLEALNEQYPNLAGYYLPLLPKSASDNAAFIIGGMSVMASNANRARTIIIFTDVDRFNQLVGVESKAAIQLFLLDTTNQIRWQVDGSYDDDKLQDLAEALATIGE